MRSKRDTSIHFSKDMMKQHRKYAKNLRKAYLGSSRKLGLASICKNDKELAKLIKNLKIDRHKLRRIKKKCIKL